MVKKAGLVVVSTLIALLGCEVFVRAFMPQISEHDAMFIADGVLGWRFIPDTKGTILYPGGIQQEIRTNPSGFRDAPFPSKQDTVKKILVLGDSFVSNISVADDEVFTEVMEANMRNTSVLNFGVNGYGQVQELLLMEKRLPEIRPDLVVVMVYLRNDFRDNLGTTDWLYPRPKASKTENTNDLTIVPAGNGKMRFNRPKKKWYHQLHLYHFVSQRARNIKAKTSENVAPENSLFIPPEHYLCKETLSEESKEMFFVLQELLMRISKKAEIEKVPIVFALAPSMVQVEDNLWQKVVLEAVENPSIYHRTLPNDSLVVFGKENQLQILDLFPALYRANKKGVNMYHPIEQHWTPEGNRVVAEEIEQYLHGMHLEWLSN